MLQLHVAKTGETVATLSLTYKVLPSHIREDNPFLENYADYFLGGERVYIRTVESMVDIILNKVKDKSSTLISTIESKEEPDVLMSGERDSISYDGFEVKADVTGIGTIKPGTQTYVRIDAGVYEPSKILTEETMAAVLDYKNEEDGMHHIGGEVYVPNADIEIVPLNEEKLAALNATLSVPEPKKIEESQEVSVDNAHRFERLMTTSYKRSRLQVIKEDKNYTIELRVLQASFANSNEYAPSRTNAGWAVNVGGEGLEQINVTCYFLDTLAVREHKDFMSIYKQFMRPRNESDYFSSPLVSFIHKSVEYKGFIVSTNLTDDAQLPLTQNFNFSFLVMKDLPVKAGDKNQMKLVLDRKGIGEHEFLSDINNVFRNVVTGE